MTDPDDAFNATHEHPLNEHGTLHGKVSSWVLVTVAVTAFAVGGAALILGTWWLVYLCAGVFAVCPLGGLVVGIMDDTVQWSSPPSTVNQPHERPQ